MDWTAKSDLFLLLLKLMPGFLAAWIFHGLTAHERRDAFERVVQALIFTGVVQALLLVVKKFALFFGSHVLSIGTWNDEGALLASVGIAVAAGLCTAICANKDVPHRWLRQWRLTTRTAYPSEWCAAFHCERRMIVLHRKDGRRIYGEPVEWPDQNDKGHFVLEKPHWVINETGARLKMFCVHRMLIQAVDVDWVEIETIPEEHGLDDDKLRKEQSRIEQLYKEKSDGCERQ